MRTGLTKKQKITAIYFDEYGNMIEVQTHNTDLKKRLTFDIEKGRLSFRLTAPYSEERKRTASEWAKNNGSIANFRKYIV